MYLDNVIKSAQAANMPEISYSEIIEDALHMVEVEGAGQLALLKAEATSHIMGSEAAGDWWVKIKTVARKIFEMLKNLITKVFAFIKSVPTKVGTLITRILTQWEKAGMKSKIDRMNKKTGIEVREEAFKELQDRAFDAFTMDKEGTNFIRALGGYELVVARTSKLVAALNKDDNDKLEEETQAIRELIIRSKDNVDDKEKAFQEAEQKPFDGVTTTDRLINVITSYWTDLKNRTYEKQTSQAVREFEKFTRAFASNYRMAMSAYERHTRDENETGVRNAIEAAKTLRAVTSVNASFAAKIAKYGYRDALIAARIVNAGLAVLKGGERRPASAGTPKSTIGSGKSTRPTTP